MKKIACLVLASLLLSTLVSGCSTISTVDNTIQSTPVGGQQVTTPTKNEPEIVNLTVSNIEQYVAFSIDINDADKWGAVDIERCSAKLTVKTMSKQRVEFKNLTVTFKLVPHSSYVGLGWDKVCCYGSNEEFTATLNIPYTGIWEEVFKIQSEAKNYVGTDPMLRLVVTHVTGQAIIEQG